MHSQIISAHLDTEETDKRSSLTLEKELDGGEEAVMLKNSVNNARCGLGPNASLESMDQHAMRGWQMRGTELGTPFKE